MPKYFSLAKITFQEYFTYRLNFILWRFRNLIFFLSVFFFWMAIFENRNEVLGYQKSQMLAYIIGVALLRSVILASRSVDLPGLIRNGDLNKLILQPFNFFSFWFTKDVVDKLLNIIFVLVEIGIILAIFKFPFYIPQNPATYAYFTVIIFIAIFLSFFLNFFLSVTSFWTEDIWATRWLFGVIFLEFFAGSFFPIDVLPKAISSIVYLTPFPYLIFFPLKIWNEQLSFDMIFKAIFICSSWTIFFYFLSCGRCY